MTAASATAHHHPTSCIDLYLLPASAPYRKRAVFLMHDSTIKAIRKLKDGNGAVPVAARHDGRVEPDRLLGRTGWYTSTLHARHRRQSAKPHSLRRSGSSYWMADREGRSMQAAERAVRGHRAGGLPRASERVDGRAGADGGRQGASAMKSA